MAPTISVVIPTYNRSKLLPNALKSVLAQTYTDYELIVIDDGSSDDTRENLKPFMDRIRYYYQNNRGASAAQNSGIQVARGKWISILASDDVWMPTKLEQQIKALDTLGDQFGACFTDCSYMGDPTERLSVFERAGFTPDCEFGALRNPIKYILGTYPALYVQSLMVLRSLVTEADGFDEALAISEDRDLMLRLALKTNFCFVSAPLVRIDATPTVPRLTDLLVHKNDQLYSWFEYRCKKWLALPELVDDELRRAIEEELVSMYYGWAVERLQNLRLVGAVQKIFQIRHFGHGYFTIMRTLGARGAKKLLRTLRR